MSIWGSILGGVIGFSFGGPFGALLGSFLGGKISRLSSVQTIGKQQNSQEIFALSLIVLSAKLSKADGQVSKEELVAVKDKLQIPDSEIDQVAKIFNMLDTNDVYIIILYINKKHLNSYLNFIYQPFVLDQLSVILPFSKIL